MSATCPDTFRYPSNRLELPARPTLVISQFPAKRADHLIATHKPTETELIAVENFSWNPFMIPPEDHRIITHRVLRYNIAHCNTHIFEGSSADFYRQYKGEVPAMVFIDACHLYEGVKEDIDWVVGLGVPVISGHDYCDLHEGVRRAVDEVFGGDITAIGSVWSHRS